MCSLRRAAPGGADLWRRHCGLHVQVAEPGGGAVGNGRGVQGCRVVCYGGHRDILPRASRAPWQCSRGVVIARRAPLCAQVLTVSLTSNPLCIGMMLSAMIYCGGHISGAHYNPVRCFGRPSQAAAAAATAGAACCYRGGSNERRGCAPPQAITLAVQLRFMPPGSSWGRAAGRVVAQTVAGMAAAQPQPQPQPQQHYPPRVRCVRVRRRRLWNVRRRSRCAAIAAAAVSYGLSGKVGFPHPSGPHGNLGAVAFEVSSARGGGACAGANATRHCRRSCIPCCCAPLC